MGLSVEGLGFGVWGLGFGVWILGQDSGFVFRVSGFGLRVSGSGSRVSGFGSRVSVAEQRAKRASSAIAVLGTHTSLFNNLYVYRASGGSGGSTARMKRESGPLRAVHVSRHKWPGGSAALQPFLPSGPPTLVTNLNLKKSTILHYRGASPIRKRPPPFYHPRPVGTGLLKGPGRGHFLMSEDSLWQSHILAIFGFDLHPAWFRAMRQSAKRHTLQGYLAHKKPPHPRTLQ